MANGMRIYFFFFSVFLRHYLSSDNASPAGGTGHPAPPPDLETAFRVVRPLARAIGAVIMAFNGAR